MPKPYKISNLSVRAQKGLSYPSMGEQNVAHSKDPYCSSANKKGIIKLSSADNVLSEDLIYARFKRINWSKFDHTNLFVYPRDCGEISTLKCMADFINRYCRQNQPQVNWEELVLLPGVSSCIDLLSQILFDPGEVLLVPAPYYYRFINDFGERGLVDIMSVPALCDNHRTELRVENFDGVYQEAIKKGKRVRAIILTNPQNPEGSYFSLDEIRPVVQWALERDIFVILDEIYDLTVFDENPKFPFRSGCSLFEGEASKYLIWIWGISKNFSMPGLRFAVLHSANDDIRSAANRFVMLHIPNTLTQFVAREFFSDYDWVENVFLPENHRRLKAARDHLISMLETINVPYIKPRAGFFILVDFGRFLDELTFDGERRLNYRFFKNRVMLTAGETMLCKKPGWFRIVFSSVDRDTLTEAFQRILKTLNRN